MCCAEVQLSHNPMRMHYYLLPFSFVFSLLFSTQAHDDIYAPVLHFSNNYDTGCLTLFPTTGRCGITQDSGTQDIMQEMWARNTLGIALIKAAVICLI